MIDRDVRWRNQYGLGMRKGIEAVLPVVISDTGRSHASVRHGLNEQKNVGLIYGSSPKRKGLQHAVDRLLVSAEHVAGERLWHRLDLRKHRTKVRISEDGQ